MKNICPCDDLHGKQLYWDAVFYSTGRGEGHWEHQGGAPIVIPFGGACHNCGRIAPSNPGCLCRAPQGIIGERDGAETILSVYCEPEPHFCEGDPPQCPFCGRVVSADEATYD